MQASKNKLTVSYNNPREKTHADDTGSIQANHEVPRNRCVYYFEVTINSVHPAAEGLHESKKTITVGFAERNFKLTRQLGYALALAKMSCGVVSYNFRCERCGSCD
jgi:hypothetical protein